MNSKTDAVVLKASAYKENDVILSLLSADGRIDAIARGVKKSRKSLLYTQPFAYSSFCLYRSGNKGLYVIDSAEPKESFYELRNDLASLCLAQYFAEACYFLPKESASGDEEKFLKLFLNSLYVLSKKPEINPAAAKVVFELKFAKYQGFAPDFSSCCECGKDEGYAWIFDRGILCEKCAENRGGYRINEKVRKLITHVLSAENMSAYGIYANESSLAYISSITEKYFSFVTERTYSTLDCYKQIKDTELLVKKGKATENE